MFRTSVRARGLLLCVTLLWLTACGQQMANQPRIEPYEESDFFTDDQGMRQLPQNVVPQAPGTLQEDGFLYTGQPDPAGDVTGQVTTEGEADGETTAEGQDSGAVAPQPVSSEEFPYEITMEDLERGQERYNIFCEPCHSLDGSGQGMVPRRGYPPAPSFHQDRLREQPAGYYYAVITNGFARMPSYAPWISVTDRWAIAAYVKVLQRSQNATIEDVPQEEREQMMGPTELEALLGQQ